ncbi:hypothetical protein [Flavobacterium sp. AG291]|uniref:hypothetical protein n=1 Tax=Flavobacterium sp. AG291 TaxID=2184000 RepID=UPI001F46C14D|nr:hypothetical protein [Flavobacterium sp. AG291]
MIKQQLHNFHIPVMGLAYTIDSPIKVARFGIDSVISIVDDELIENMNAFYSRNFELPYKEITRKTYDYRAKRITSYLNLVDTIVKKKFNSFCDELATNKKALNDFVAMLPKISSVKKNLDAYLSNQFSESSDILKYLSENLFPGAIDVNIMTKVDKTNYDKNDSLPNIYNDAHSALRGFANSNLSSSLVLSAGMNPSLFSYIAEFDDFLPDDSGLLKKKVTLKVSDFRSAMIQGSFLAKKGIWVSEYRIESGLNCGGHAFATDGLLLGPIMQEFKDRKQELINTTHSLLQKAFSFKGKNIFESPFEVKFTVQGGVGTAEEHDFLLNYYEMDSVGWGSPFLLVPEATTTDKATRILLANAKEKDFYRSDISPLGVPFNTLVGTTNEYIKTHRILQNKAGSSCPKKLLALSKEYDEKGICTASRKYQQLKLEELQEINCNLSSVEFEKTATSVTVKSCLCVGLANPAYLENDIPIKGEAQGVVVCPGPNMAYFDKEVSLKDMVRHIYGYQSILPQEYRPNVFVKELELYVEYLEKNIAEVREQLTPALIKKWELFKSNLLQGILYYEDIFKASCFFESAKNDILENLKLFRQRITIVNLSDAEVIK